MSHFIFGLILPLLLSGLVTHLQHLFPLLPAHKGEFLLTLNK